MTRSFCDCPPFFDELCIGASGSVSLPGIAGRITSALSRVLPAGIQIRDVDVTLSGEGELCLCCQDGCYDVFTTGSLSADLSVVLFWGLGISSPPLPEGGIEAGDFVINSLSGSADLGVEATLTGNVTVERTGGCKEDGDLCISGSLGGRIEAGPNAEGSISATSMSTGITYTGNATARYTAIGTANATAQWCQEAGGSFTACATAEITGEISASLSATDNEGNMLTAKVDFPLPTVLPLQTICTGVGGAASVRAGSPNTPAFNALRATSGSNLKAANILSDPEDPLAGALPEPIDFSDLVVSNDNLLSLPEIEALLPQNSDGVCSRVAINLSQEAVTTRTAFLATLELGNGLEDGPLTDVGFDIDIRDLNNQPSNDFFNIRVTQLEGLDAIDGTGTIAAGESGLTQWTLIPRDTAAPLEDTIYFISGTIRYNQAGTEFSVPVEPTPITVRPDAALSLRYFHQRDVVSDDPFTDPLELPEPYYLAVQVCNTGAGEARNLRIDSAQPEIVENERGLLIDFMINSTSVDGLPAEPTLSADFGTIAPGTKRTAVWEMESTLQGHFINYEADFEHLDGLGDPRISLVRDVSIHEMIRLVEAQGSKDDGLPDFLVNDVPDVNDYPDTMYLSDGAIEPVSVLETATVTNSGATSYTVAIPPSLGWAYLRIADPTNGNLELQSVVRNDGQVLPVGLNTWTSDRTFVGLGQRPLLENIFHLVDCDTTGIYTLTFVEVSNEDNFLPTSSVDILPGTLGEEIALNWSGQDVGTGIASYDIFVSVDNGPFEVFLSDTRQTVALFPGTNGTNYAFVSIATDRAGNVEEFPAQPDAAILLNSENLAPSLVGLSDISIVEGDTLNLRAFASDPDGPLSGLRYSVASLAPGVVIDELSGELSWVSGEGDAGRSIGVTVTVTDSGVPVSSTSRAFEVTVTEVNSPPIVDELAPQAVPVSGALLVQAEGRDLDFPLQNLTWSLGAGAPDTMRIDPSTGLITWSPSQAFADQSLAVEVILSDSGVPAATDSTMLAIEVIPRENQAPDLAEIPVAVWTEGQFFSLQVFATDFENDPISLEANLSDFPNSFFSDQGNGIGTFSWNTSGVQPGTYLVPINATANGDITSGFIEVRILENNVYWEWVIDNFGSDFVDVSLLDRIQTDANPDGDRLSNLFEMALLTDPNEADSPPLELNFFQAEGAFGQIGLQIYRRTGSEQFVDLFPERNLTLEDGWSVIPRQDWSARVDPLGDNDGRPETQLIDFSIFEFYPEGSPPERSFYRIEASETPSQP